MSLELKWEENHTEQSSTIGFILDGPTDSTSARVALLADLPPTYDWKVFNGIESLKLIPPYSSLWEVRVKYGAFQQKRDLQSGESEFRFETGSVQSRRTISISSRVFNAEGLVDPPPEDARIIGWNQKAGKAAGTSVDERAYSFGWTIVVPFSTGTESYRRQAGELVKTVCTGSFFGYSAGEVRFDSIRGTARSSDEYRWDLQFSRRPNYASLTIGGVTIENLKGWEELDIDSQTWAVDEDSGLLIPQVDRVKVHQLYPEASWSLLSTLLGV